MSWSKIAGSILWLVSGVVWAAQDPIGWGEFIDSAAMSHVKQPLSDRSHAKDVMPFLLRGTVISEGAITDIVIGEVITGLPPNMLLNTTKSISFSFSNTSLTETA